MPVQCRSTPQVGELYDHARIIPLSSRSQGVPYVPAAGLRIRCDGSGSGLAGSPGIPEAVYQHHYHNPFFDDLHDSHYNEYDDSGKHQHHHNDRHYHSNHHHDHYQYHRGNFNHHSQYNNIYIYLYDYDNNDLYLYLYLYLYLPFVFTCVPVLFGVLP